MKITVRFYGVAHDTTGTREWQPELPEGSKVIDMLDLIVETYPSLTELVYDEAGFRDYLAVSINNIDILGLSGVETILHEGDLVFVMPPIGGG